MILLLLLQLVSTAAFPGLHGRSSFKLPTTGLNKGEFSNRRLNVFASNTCSPTDHFLQLGNDIDGEKKNDYSGQSVSMSSDGLIVAIGSIYNTGANGNDSGHVRVFEYDGTTWTQLGSDIDGDRYDDNSGFSVSLSCDGSIVAVGSIKNDGDKYYKSDSGHVRVFQFISNTWTQIGNDIQGEKSGDESGYSVHLSADGHIVAIGAIKNDAVGYETDSGHVRVYQYDGATWIKMGNDIDGENAGDKSGSSVSLSADGQVVAIGAYDNDGANGSYSGHVRVYEFVSNNWSQVGSDIDGEAPNDASGVSVSLSSDGSIVAIGAYLNDGTGDKAGHTRVYQNVGGSWTQLGSDIDGERAKDESGYSISLSADGLMVAIGAYYNDDGGTNSGHARVYKYVSSSWTKYGPDIDGEKSYDWSGIAVSLSRFGTAVAIGAYGNDGAGTSDSGHVRVMKICSESGSGGICPSDSHHPSEGPSSEPSSFLSSKPSPIPSQQPSLTPSLKPSPKPSSMPSLVPTHIPSSIPSTQPTLTPSIEPSKEPSSTPSSYPTRLPSSNPTSKPSLSPSVEPSNLPTTAPTYLPSSIPSSQPSSTPSESTMPSSFPTSKPSTTPSQGPTSVPTLQPSSNPSESSIPSSVPSSKPSSSPSQGPSSEPTNKPSFTPTSEPSTNPSFSVEPTSRPSYNPSMVPSSNPSSRPTSLFLPSKSPSVAPSTSPPTITSMPTTMPSSVPSDEPSPSGVTLYPSSKPSNNPSTIPSSSPSSSPSTKYIPSAMPSSSSSPTHSSEPSLNPSTTPSLDNEPLPLSWNLTLISVQSSVNENDQPVMGIDFLLSNRDYDVKLFEDDCETNTSVPLLEYSDTRSSTQGFIDVDLNITINQADIEASSIWNATDESFSFCVVTSLYANENKTEANVVSKKQQIFTVKVNKESGVGGGDLLDVEISNPGPDVNSDFIVNFDGILSAYRCDPTTLEPISSPPPLGQFDVLNICVEETSDENITIGTILDLTLEQNETFTTFKAIENGQIKPGYEAVVQTSCSFGKCLAQVQLINSFFLDESSPPIKVTGTVLLAFGGSARFVDLGVSSPAYRSIKTPEKSDQDENGRVKFETTVGLSQPCQDGNIFGGGVINFFSGVFNAVLKTFK